MDIASQGSAWWVQARLSQPGLYVFEEQSGHSHLVTGDIACHADNIEIVLKSVFVDVV